MHDPSFLTCLRKMRCCFDFDSVLIETYLSPLLVDTTPRRRVRRSTLRSTLKTESAIISSLVPDIPQGYFVTYFDSKNPQQPTTLFISSETAGAPMNNSTPHRTVNRVSRVVMPLSFQKHKILKKSHVPTDMKIDLQLRPNRKLLASRRNDFLIFEVCAKRTHQSKIIYTPQIPLSPKEQDLWEKLCMTAFGRKGQVIHWTCCCSGGGANQ